MEIRSTQKKRYITILLIVAILALIITGILIWRAQQVSCFLIPLAMDTDSIEVIPDPYYKFLVKNDRTLSVRYIERGWVTEYRQGLVVKEKGTKKLFEPS